MRHLKKRRKLGRTTSHRKATLNNLARALVQYELIQMIDAKVKEFRRVSDRLITLGKKDTLAARRRVFAILRDRDMVAKVFGDLAKRDELAERQGGYTRIIKLGNRRGDAAPLSRVSWVGATVQSTEKLRYPAHILDRFDEVKADADDEVEETDEG